MVFLKRRHAFHSVLPLLFAFQIGLSSQGLAMDLDFDEKGSGGALVRHGDDRSDKGGKVSPKGPTILIELDANLREWLARVYPKGASNTYTEPTLNFLIEYEGGTLSSAGWSYHTPISYMAGSPPRTCEIDLTKFHDSSLRYDLMTREYNLDRLARQYILNEKGISMHIACSITMELKDGLKPII